MTQSRVFIWKLGLQVVIALMVMPTSSVAMAIDWQLSKGFGARASTTSVSTTASEDEATQRSLLGLSTFINLSGTGRRASLGLNVGLEAQQVLGEDEEFNYRRSLGLSSRTELVERFAVLDTSARVSRRSVDGNPLNDGDTFLDEETDDEVREFSIGPSISDRIADSALYQASYRFSVVRSSEDSAVGSDTHQVGSRFILVSGPNGPYWFAGAEYENARFENEETAYTGLIGLGIAYRLRPTLLGSVVVGREWTQLSDSISSTEDEFYNVNLRWQPSRRLIAAIGYAERAFGRRPRASVELIGRRSSVDLEWSRESALLDDSDLFDSLDFAQEGASLDDESDSNGFQAPDEPLAPFVGDVFSVTEEISLSYQLTGRVSTMTVTATYFEREELTNDVQTNGRELSAQFSRQLSRRIDWTASLAVGRGRTSTDGETEQRANAELSIRVAL